MEKHLSSAGFLVSIIAASVSVFAAILIVAANCPEFDSFVRPWQNFVGTFLGAIVAFAALGLAAIINDTLSRKLEKDRADARRVALYRVLQSECRALRARCGIWRKKFVCARREDPGCNDFAVPGPFGLPTLQVVEKHMDEVGGFDKSLSDSTFSLYHALSAAQHTIEANRRFDGSFDAQGIDEVRGWLRSIFKEADQLEKRLAEHLDRQ